MLRHSLIIALRNIRKHTSSFFINLVGLSTGLACALLIFMWVRDEMGVNAFHAKDDRLFQVMEHQAYSDGLMTTTSTPGVLAETLADEIPEVEHAISMEWGNELTLTHDGKSVSGEGIHVGRDFFHVFSYPLLIGSKDDVLAEPTNIVLSESIAIALFGSFEQVIGKTVSVDHEGSYMIKGIFADMPSQSTYQFDFLMNWEKFKDENEWVLSWGNNGPGTIVTLKEGSDSQLVNDKISDFVKERNEDSKVTLFLKPFSERYLYGRYENGIVVGGRIEYVRLFTIIAIFILTIACINFMNLSTARATRRAKEVGIKKTVGANRRLLAAQFLSESLLVTFASFIVAIGLVMILLPQFNLITEKSLKLTSSFDLWGLFIGVTLATGILAGSYPALYLSGFKPVKVLKGRLSTSTGEVWARKGLVIFQFAISAFLITSVLVIYKQVDYVQSQNLGYAKDQLVYFSVKGELEDHLDPFFEQVRNIRGVASVTSIGHDLIGRQNNTSGLQWDGKNPEDNILFENVSCNYDALSTLGIELLAGRDFSREFGTDTNKIIFNEAAIDVMGYEDPVGKSVRLWGRYDLEIIGVVKNFHFQSLKEHVKPLFFLLSPQNTWNVMVRIEAGQEQLALTGLQETYEAFNPGFPFSYEFVDEQYAELYAAEQRVSLLSRYFAGIAIIISCLGLFGLASFTGDRRKKEIGIRKILGASSFNIVRLLTSEFSRLVLVAIIIGLPLAFVVLKNWLTSFAFRIDLGIWFFLITGLVVILISWLTVGVQALRAAQVHPQECLKVE